MSPPVRNLGQSRFARRYSSRVIVRAQKLSEAGWGRSKIAKLLLQEFGVEPSERSIQTWCAQRGRTDEERQRDRVRHRRLYRERHPRPLPNVSEDWKLERMREMFERNLSTRAIGQVAAVWWGEELTGAEVQRRLGIRDGELRQARRAA